MTLLPTLGPSQVRQAADGTDEAEWPKQLLLLRDFSSALSAKLKGFPSLCQKHRSKGVQWWGGDERQAFGSLENLSGHSQAGS